MLYRLGKLLLQIYLGILHRPIIRGVSNVPRQGGLIAISNHTSWLDPAAIAVSVGRQVCFMAKEELFSNFLFGAFLRSCGTFPVRRGRPDRKALRRALEILEEGGVLGLFPEGTRSRDGQLKPFEPGTALLAVKAGVPVLPIAIGAPYHPFRRLRVEILPPVDLSSYRGQRMDGGTLAQAAEEIRQPLARALGAQEDVREEPA